MMIAVIILGLIIFLMLPLWVEGFKLVFSEIKKNDQNRIITETYRPTGKIEIPKNAPNLQSGIVEKKCCDHHEEKK